MLLLLGYDFSCAGQHGDTELKRTWNDLVLFQRAESLIPKEKNRSRKGPDREEKGDRETEREQHRKLDLGAAVPPII